MRKNLGALSIRLTQAILATLGMLFACAAPAQAPARIAWVYPSTSESSGRCVAALKNALREQGLVEGKQYVLDMAYADGDHNRFPALAKEALQKNPALVIGQTIASIRAIQQATRTVPIVFMGVNDPVHSGLVTNLARPEGNATGTSNQGEDLMAKHIELLREIFPKSKRVAVLVNPSNGSHPRMLEAVRASTARVGMAMQSFNASAPAEFPATFGEIGKYRPDALLVITDSMFVGESGRIASLALKHRLPTIAGISTSVEAGGLISYGASGLWFCQSGAPYVSSLLKGIKPAELPVQQPTVFELLINTKTAKTLGLTLPKSVLAKADRLVQ
jgi:putative ABC transport system substrate-binding protein